MGYVNQYPCLDSMGFTNLYNGKKPTTMDILMGYLCDMCGIERNIYSDVDEDVNAILHTGTSVGYIYNYIYI